MKKIRHFITLLALTCMIAGQTLISFAANTTAVGGASKTAGTTGTVTYDCNAHVFIMEPGSDKSPTDLFGNFKDVIPGQTLTQEIVIRNDEKSDMISKIYLRSLGATEQSKEFLSQLTLQVSSGEAKGIFHAPADEAAQLSDWVCLGELEPGASVQLYLTLEVPITLDNKFQEAAGTLQWEFRSEELPIPEDEEPIGEPDITPEERNEIKPPKTGDSAGISFYLFVVLLSIWGICGFITVKKRRMK